MPEQFVLVGNRIPRADAVEKVKGIAKFAAAIQLPRMLHARFLRSPHAHAKIISIDTTKAEAVPGVKAILTHRNVPKVHAYAMSIPSHEKFEYLLDETVHCVGEEVAAIAATTKEIAEKALELIEVEYEVLPAVFDKEEAMKPGAPLVHPELGSNMYQCPRSSDGKLTLEYGSVEQGFAEADHVIEGTYESPIQHNVSPEPRAVVCEWIGDSLTCWAGTQMPEETRQELAKCLDLPLSSIRVISSSCVGGYGHKQPGKISVLTALLAKKTGGPVKANFTREEDFIATHHRVETKAYAKVGVTNDGTITAAHVKMTTNYGRDSSCGYLIPAAAAVYTCSMLYRYRNSRWEGYHVLTNTSDHGPMNGFGDPEAGFCIERLMDEAAEKIEMDPVEFRLRNCARYGDKGMDMYPVVFGPIEWGVVGPDIDSFPECIRRIAEKASWKDKWKGWKTPMEASGATRRGIGVAIGMHGCLGPPQDSCTVKMNQDGTADVLSGDPEIGQGLKTAMGQVVAEVLGLRFQDVNVTLADTSVTPYSRGIFASRGTTAGIGTAYRAALDVKRQLFETAAGIIEAKPEELEAKERMLRVKGHPERGVPISVVCMTGNQITAHSVLPFPWIDERSGKRVTLVGVAATIAEVEVDSETGKLDVLRMTSAVDCGKAINPTLVENQVDCAITMANGWVRTEEMIIDKKTGMIINPNMLDYKLMTILDMPKMDDLHEVLVEVPMPWGPFGAKGMAETAITSPAPAIANAVYNAIGVRVRGDHLTPQRILQALRENSNTL